MILYHPWVQRGRLRGTNLAYIVKPGNASKVTRRSRTTMQDKLLIGFSDGSILEIVGCTMCVPSWLQVPIVIIYITCYCPRIFTCIVCKGIDAHR